MRKSPTPGTGAPKRRDLPDDPEQSKRFEEMALELGSDESERAFEAALGILKSTNEKAPPPAKPVAGRKVKKST